MAKNTKTIIVLLAAAFVTTGGSISAEISKDDISKIVGANPKPFHQVWDDPTRLALIEKNIGEATEGRTPLLTAEKHFKVYAGSPCTP